MAATTRRRRGRLPGRSLTGAVIHQRPGTTFRGRTVLRSHGWIAIDERQSPIAYIGGDVYDRWVRYHGEGPHGALISDEIRARSMGLAYVVDPSQWRRGYGPTAISAILDHADVTDIDLFFCGIDADDHASQRCATAAGFHVIDASADHEGMLYFHHEHRTNRPQWAWVAQHLAQGRRQAGDRHLKFNETRTTSALLIRHRRLAHSHPR